MREDIRHLALGIVFCTTSLTLNFFGLLVIDFLPDIVGVVFFWQFLRQYGGRQPAWVQLCRIYALVYALGLIFPLYEKKPALAALVHYWGAVLWTLCLAVLIGRCFLLLEQLAHQAGREDLAASARRFLHILMVLYSFRILLHLTHAIRAETAVFMLWSILNLLLAAFAANCQVLAPPEKTAEV